jgi:hypothetical protein
MDTFLLMYLLTRLRFVLRIELTYIFYLHKRYLARIKLRREKQPCSFATGVSKIKRFV